MRGQSILGLLLTLEMIFASGISAQSNNQVLKIGVILCLSGECAEWGSNSLKGIQLAVDEINTKGGVLVRKIELEVEDTREATSGATAVQAYRKLLLDSELHYIIGPTWTPAGKALAPIIAKTENVIVVSPSLGVADYNEAGDNIFNVWPHDDISTRKLARVALKQGLKRAAIFSSTQPWESLQGNAFEDEFKKYGGKVVAKVEPLPESNDLKTEALRITNAKPDVVFFSITNRMGLAAREIARFNYSGKKMAVLIDHTRLLDAKGSLEGTIFARYPEAQESFKKSFQDSYREIPGITADTAYDAVYLLARSIEEAKTLETKVVSSFVAKANFQSASGRIVFDGKGGIVREPTLWVVHGMEYEKVAQN